MQTATWLVACGNKKLFKRMQKPLKIFRQGRIRLDIFTGLRMTETKYFGMKSLSLQQKGGSGPAADALYAPYAL